MQSEDEGHPMPRHHTKFKESHAQNSSLMQHGAHKTSHSLQICISDVPTPDRNDGILDGRRLSWRGRGKCLGVGEINERLTVLLVLNLELVEINHVQHLAHFLLVLKIQGMCPC